MVVRVIIINIKNNTRIRIVQCRMQTDCADLRQELAVQCQKQDNDVKSEPGICTVIDTCVTPVMVLPNLE